VGVRAEDLVLQPSEGDEGIRLAVDVVEPMVQERQQLVHGSAGNQRLVGRVSSEKTVRRGDVLHLTPDSERLHLFDPATRVRIGDGD